MVSLQLSNEGSRKKLCREYIKKVGGGLFYKSNFCFCLDGTAVCLVSGDSFSVYRSDPLQRGTVGQNSHVPRHFISKSHDKRITRVVSHPVDTAVVLSASEDGTLKIWDVEEGVLQKTIDIGLPVENCVYDAKCADTVYCLCKKLSAVPVDALFQGQQQQQPSEGKMQRASYRGRKSHKVISVQISNGKVSTLFQVKRPRCFISVSSEPALLVGTDYGLHCYFLDRKENRALHIPHSKPITCIAYHEETDTFAVGEETGIIRVFRGFMATLSKSMVVNSVTFLNSHKHSKFHWHSKMVLSLAFSVNGMRLFSGGMEGVLVSWKVSTGEHTFLPRLGGGIRHLMVESNRNVIGVTTRDNCFKLLDASNGDLLWQIRGIWSWTAFRPGTKENTWMDFVKCIWTPHGTPHLLLPGRSGRLQIYDIAQDRHFMEVDLFYFNYLPTCIEEAKRIPFISHLCVTRDMSSIITLERRCEDDSLPVEFSAQVIHFYEQQSSHYVLKSRMYIQSKDSFIVDMFCHPYSPMLCTLHKDGSFRLWSRVVVVVPQEKQQSSAKWYCIHRWNDSRRCHSMATCSIRGVFSRDGSLLMIGYGNLISFWKWEENNISLLTEKSFDVGDIESLHCLGGNCGLLIATTATSFLVIDLIQMELLWSQQVVHPIVACDDFSSRFAVVYSASSGEEGKKHFAQKMHKISIYEPFSVDPLYVFDAKGISVKAIFYSSSIHLFDASRHYLLVMDDEFQIYICNPQQQVWTEQEQQLQPHSNSPQHPTTDTTVAAPYFRILGEKLYSTDWTPSHAEMISYDAIMQEDSNRHPTMEFQDVPSHVLPTPQELLDTLFGHYSHTLSASEDDSLNEMQSETTLEKPWSLSPFSSSIEETAYSHFGQRLWKKWNQLN